MSPFPSSPVCGCKTDWYEKGLEAEQRGDYSKALEYYQKGAGKDDCFCMSMIARYYQKSLGGLPHDETEALQWYQKAANAGLPSSYVDIGKIYLYGKGVPEDPNRAIHNFNLAIRGTPEGLHELGKMYYDGIGVQKDYKKAFEYFQDAVNKGWFEAERQLVVMYTRGDFVEQDEKKAIEIFTKSPNHPCELKDAKAFLASQLYLNIGLDYLQGKCAPKDEQRAFPYIELAAEWGDDEAMETLAGMYGYGVGIEKDVKKAEELYKKAIQEANDISKFHCQYLLGYLYLQAFEPPEYEKAIACFVETAEDFCAPSDIAGTAMHQLSVLYLAGIGIEYDEEKGNEWFEKAVNRYKKEIEEEKPLYMYKLGQLYETGPKQKQDMQKAIYWYQKAADEGWEEAKIKLKELKNNQFQHSEVNIEKINKNRG